MAKFNVKLGENKVINGYYYEGFAFLGQRKDAQFVVIAVTEEDLKEAYMSVVGGSLDMDKVQRVVAASPNCMKASQVKPVAEILEDRKNDLELIWILHPESSGAFMAYRRELAKDLSLVELGPAIRETTTECMILLRQHGWSREEINKLDIQDNDIPF